MVIENFNILYLVIIFVVAYYILHIFDSRFGHLIRPTLNKNYDLNRDLEYEELKKQLEDQKQIFISQLEAQAKLFEQKLEQQKQQFEIKIKSLEQYNSYLMQRIASREKTNQSTEYIDNNKMLFVSAEDAFYSRDRVALFRAGLRFTTLRDCNSEMLNKELRRGRESGRPYRLVLVSAHGYEGGIQLSDGIFSGDYFASNFFGVEIALFASCKSFNILNDLIGIVDYSIGLMDDIETDLAEDFIYNFWKEYLETMNAIKAFENVKKVMPEISDRVIISYKG